MENQEIVIKGTISGIIAVLEKDFNMPYEEAKFFVYVLLNKSEGRACNVVKQDELNHWYSNEEDDKYQGQILHTHLVINFDNIKKELIHKTYIYIWNFFISKGIEPVLIGAELIYIIVSAIKKIKDTDYCIYAKIIELCIGNKNRLFDISEVVTANRDGKCDYQSDEWKCIYLSQYENCNCDIRKIKLSFQSLEEQNVIKKVGERWMLVQ